MPGRPRPARPARCRSSRRPRRRGSRNRRGRQAGCRRIGSGERVVLVDDLVVGHPRPGDDHAEHSGVLRVEQRNRLEYALPGRIRQCGSVRHVIGGRLDGDLARHVTAGCRLSQIQREHWRRGPDQGDPASGRCPERLGVAAGERVKAEIDQAAGHAAGRRLPGVGIVIGQRDRARPAHGRGDADRQGEVAGQPAVEGQPVGPHPEAGHRGQLPGKPVHIGRMTAAARVTGSEPDELFLPLPHFRQARHACGRTAGCHAHPRSSSRAGVKSGRNSLLTATVGADARPAGGSVGSARTGQICTQVTADNVTARMVENTTQRAGARGVLPGLACGDAPGRCWRASGPSGPWM